MNNVRYECYMYYPKQNTWRILDHTYNKKSMYLMYVNNKCCFEIYLNFIHVQFDVVAIPFHSITMDINAIKDIKRKIALYSSR